MTQTPRGQSGFSLIEMMIAMVLGLLVAAGIVTVFQSTSGSNRVQRQLAVLQEEGRFAVNKIKDDVSLANSQYCSNTGGNAGQTSAGVALDALRSPTVYANVAGGNALNSLPDLTNTLPTATTPFSMPSSIFMRGYDCTKTACTPTDPNIKVSAIPAQGTAVGNRVVGSSILTIRYLDPTRGWAIVPNGSSPGSTIVANGSGTLLEVDLKPITGQEPPVTDFGAGDWALLTDCSNGQIFAVSGQGSGVIKPTAANFSQPNAFQGAAAPKLFDFNKDFNTVTYYLKVADNGNGGTTGALIRRLNGTDQEMVRGIERLDFKYGVINANGNTEFLTANQVDTATDSAGNSIPCPPDVKLAGGMPTTGCLWRAVKTIEVHLLMDGQTPLYTLAANEMAYTYTIDGPSQLAPTAHAIKPSDQGFPNQLLRREFTVLVALRNYNP